MTSSPASPGRVVVFLVVAHLAWVAAWLLAGVGSVWFSLGLASVPLGLTAVVLAPNSTSGLLRKPSVKAIFIGLLAGGLLAVASHLFYPLIAGAFPSVPPQVQALYSRLWQGPGPLTAFAIFVWIIVAEELIWRGALQSLLERKLSPVAAAIAATLPYALAQGGQGTILLVVIALGVGLVFALLRAWTRELWAPLLCHLVWDVCVMILWPLEQLPGGN